MKLLTKELEKQLHTNKHDIAIVKFFCPWNQWTWYASSYDSTTGLFYGLVEGFEREYGVFALADLESVTGPFGLKIERDLYWEPKAFEEIR